jgi:glycosyltransferase involved in cell wall biosynthesis
MVAACPFPWPRGTPIRVHRMAEALGRRGHDVHVVAYHLGEATPTPHMTVHRIAGPKVYTHTAPGPTVTKLALLDPLLTRKLHALLRAQRFDVIHAHHYEGLLCGLLARRRRRLPLVFDAHTLLESELPSYSAIGRGLMRRIGRAFDRSLPPRADHVIAVSEELRRGLVRFERIPDSQLSVISNGVEADHFRRDTANPTRVVAFAGNLAPYQRLDLLLQAFALVLHQEPAARLRFLTDGDFTPLRALAERLGVMSSIEVTAVDYAALPEQLRAATVLANPRLVCSGVPQKLLNYMASATPVVSFASSAKMLEHEKSGLIVSDSDIPGFAAAIIRLMRDPKLAAHLGERARAIVTDEYSWDHIATRVERVYARLLGLHEEPWFTNTHETD